MNEWHSTNLVYDTSNSCESKTAKFTDWTKLKVTEPCCSHSHNQAK